MLLMREDELVGWAENAAPGDMVAYARGSITPDQAAQTRPLIDKGIIVPLFKREQGEGVYLAKRSSGRMQRMKRRSNQNSNRGRFSAKPQKRRAEGMILRMIRYAAIHQKPCPTNRELARSCRLPDDKSASYRMRQLVKAGRIQIEDHSPFGRRVVTILTGKYAGLRTAEAAI